MTSPRRSASSWPSPTPSTPDGGVGWHADRCRSGAHLERFVGQDGSVTVEHWNQVLAPERYALELRPGVEASAIAGAGDARGAPLPDSLVEFYRFTDGIFDGSGQWDVAWHLARLVEENLARRLLGFIAFGDDDGTRDWFAVPAIDGAVVHVSGVTHEQTWPAEWT